MTSAHLEHFQKILGPTGAILSQSKGDDLSAYLTDWTGKFKAQSEKDENNFVILKPKRIEQVSEILKFCNEQRYKRAFVFEAKMMIQISSIFTILGLE